MESVPVQPDTPQPDIVSSEGGLNRQPQSLSRNFEQRVKQLDVITKNPTDQQIRKFSEKLASDNPEDAGNATEMAKNSFANMQSLIQERANADAAVKQVRKEALSAPSSEFKARVAALREAEQRRTEVTSTLKTFSNDFKDAGVELDPSQIPLSLGEKLGQKAQETRKGILSGVTMAQEGIKGTAGYVGGEVGSRVEGAIGIGRRLAETGRKGLRELFGASTSTLNKAQEAGQVRFNDVKSKVEATGGRAGGGISKLAEMWKGARERMLQRGSTAWEAASVWAHERRQEIANRLGVSQENISQMLERARNSAAERIYAFNQTMQSVGEKARDRMDEVSEAISTFASEQAQRIEDMKRQTSERVKVEVGVAVEKGKIFLKPAWESIQRDRERIRQERDVYGEKLGIMVEGVSDVASPIIDRILDEARDLRDGALGFGSGQVQGLRVFGRDAVGKTVEVGSPAWNFLVERWDNLRLRANESRVRLNTFMQAVSGKAGNRFSELHQSHSERAKRASSVLAGAKIEGGKILQNGVEVSREVAEWFVQTGTTAKEFLIKQKEQIGQGIDMLRRYWEVYAVGKWKESGLADIDIKRRMKLLRATGAASLGRVASISAAAGIEGAVMLRSLARDRRGQVALSVLALGITLVVNPELRDGLQSFLSNVDASGIQLPDLSYLGGTDTTAAELMAPAMPEPAAGMMGVAPGPVISPDVVSGMPPSLPDVAGTFTSASPAGVPVGPVPAPDILASLPNLDLLNPGQPLEAQARQLAGGVNETYYNILQGGFDQFKDNFLTTAQTIADNPSNYTSGEVSLAKQQLEATARLNQDPTLIEGSKGWYDTIVKATHFWRPV